MTRVVEREEHTPAVIPKSQLPAGEAIYVCRCGLSKSQPFCDGTHKKTFKEQPGHLYRYADLNGTLEPILIKIENA